MAMDKGQPLIKSEEQDNVEIEPDFYRTVLPKSRLYPRGASKNHIIKDPRKLLPSEY